MKALNEDPTLLTEKLDEDYKRYFYDDFTQGLIKRLVRERSNSEKVIFIFDFKLVYIVHRNYS